MPSSNANSQRTGVFLAVLAFGIFATHDALIKSLGAEYAVFQIIFFSVLFGFPPIALAMSADRAIDNFRPHHPWWLALRTGAQLIAQSCAFFAFTKLPLADVYAILFATPLLITILSVPMLGETVRLRRWVAIVIGLIGVLIVLRPGGTELTTGHLAALIAAVMSSLASIIVRKVGPDERSAVLVLYPLTASVIMMAILLPFVYTPMPVTDLGRMAIVGVLAFLGQFAIIAAYKAASATLVAPMQYSQILWATFFGVVFFNEVPDLGVALGASIIIGSGVYIVLRESTEAVSDEKPVLRSANLRYDTGPSPDPKGNRRKGIFQRSSNKHRGAGPEK